MALVVVALFANAFLAANLAALIAILFVSAMLSLTGAFLAFLIEVRIATAAIRIGRPRSGSSQGRPAGQMPCESATLRTLFCAPDL